MQVLISALGNTHGGAGIKIETDLSRVVQDVSWQEVTFKLRQEG